MDYHLSNRLKAVYFGSYKPVGEYAPNHSKAPEYSGNFSNTVIEYAMAEANVKINETLRDQASSFPEINEINMPLKQQFPSAVNYYFTLIHEYAHVLGNQNQRTTTDLMDIQDKYHEDTLKDPSLAKDINVLIDKWDKIDKGEIKDELQPKEINLLCAYMKEELKADTIAAAFVEKAGYKLTPEVCEGAGESGESEYEERAGIGGIGNVFSPSCFSEPGERLLL